MKHSAGGETGTSDTIDHPGGPGAFMTQGEFSNATYQLEYSLDGGSGWTDVPGAEMTHVQDHIGLFQLPPCKLRVFWSGGQSSGPATQVNVLVAPSFQGWFNDPAGLPGT